LVYLAGYLAWKMRRKGNKSYKNITRDPLCSEELESDSWLGLLSRGGLTVPNEYIQKVVIHCEQEFRRTFECYGKSRHGFKKIYHHIRRNHSYIEAELVQEFLRVRFRIKAKQLNRCRAQRSQFNNYKAKQFLMSSK